MSALGESRQEGRGLGAVERGATGVVHEVENVALLLTQGRMHGKNAFDEATALYGMGSMADHTTEHAMADSTLGGVVRRLDALDVEEGPEVRV